MQFMGAGSYGLIYLCEDLQTKEPRAVKQLRPSKRRSKKERVQFEHEVTIIKTLNHPQMPVIYDVFSENDSHFYAMSYIEGDNLEEELFLNKKTFTEKESLLVLSQLIHLVAYLHEKNIYHQDLRTSNILIKDYQPFLIDFGLSKKINSLQSKHDPSAVSGLQQQDFYDLGELLLFLLYSPYSFKGKRALPWTEELSLEEETAYLLKRLLGIRDRYPDTYEMAKDVEAAIKAQKD
ncbi:serine/threonine protein kinase [Bacillus ectoiniformans]|uniref:serine/threonine protein kinase n=1 Tax=Bacillus ectoiniformans TaxID=1494429 RepID=UPI0023BAC22A|nr:protein kinase family protein [Bacillus ectoiniformans]